jgi:hypothetical protein
MPIQRTLAALGTALLLCVVALVVACPSRACAESRGVAAMGVVRAYFSALAERDFGGALRMTTGAALQRTHDILVDLERRAAERRAHVDLEVRHLELRPSGNGAVDARFAIDVVGKKWMFSKVARRLFGTARFYVNENTITAIAGDVRESD